MTIRNVPTETRNELASRAARSGRSLQEFLREALVEMAAKPDINDLLDEANRRKQATGSRVSADQIVESLEADRR